MNLQIFYGEWTGLTNKSCALFWDCHPLQGISLGSLKAERSWEIGEIGKGRNL